MNYNQISELLYDAIWSANETTSKIKLFKFYQELNQINGGSTEKFMKTFEDESENIKRFSLSIFKAKEFGRLPSIYAISRELVELREVIVKLQ